ncbi:MAG: hypothetical protein ACFBSG_09955 [Leptolyngbyaceae cyanobacterium]
MYLSVLVIDTASEIIVLHPTQYDTPVDAALINNGNADRTAP